MKRTSQRLLTAAVVLLAACARGRSAIPPADASTVDLPPAARPAATTSHTLTAGTRVDATIDSAISSRTGLAGDVFTARVVEDVSSADGSVTIPAGSTVQGAITEVHPASSDRSTGMLTLAVSSMTVRGRTYVINASIDSLTTVDETRGVEKADAARVAGGAAVGAVLGHVIGGNDKGTVIGAVSGAAVGAAVSALVKDVDIVLPAGAHLLLTLRQPLTVTAN